MTIKIARAAKLSIIGDCNASFSAMLDAIPAEIVAALSSRQLAALIDANWRLAGASKALAARAAIEEGGVYDTKRNIFRAFA